MNDQPTCRSCRYFFPIIPRWGMYTCTYPREGEAPNYRTTPGGWGVCDDHTPGTEEDRLAAWEAYEAAKHAKGWGWKVEDDQQGS